MCGSCGCGEEDLYLIYRPGKSEFEKGEKPKHFHVPHNQKTGSGELIHHQSFETAKKREIKIEENILSANKSIAQQNREYFKTNRILALNLVSSPGSGKTSLLETTIQQLSKELSIYVIEGDQQTQNDAERIHKAGAPVVQINTGQGCHLDASMITNAVKQLQIKKNSILFIENVGNLVCPALFDLGEKKRVIIISVTEGEDKPLKYPTMFQTSDICVINKIDLLPYVDFEIDKVKEYALRINSKLLFIEISVKNGEGLEKWYKCLKEIDID